MIATDFLELAKELQGGARESEWRSAVSRAYYAAFHSALVMATACGIRFGKSSSAHDKLALCLQNSANIVVAKAGAKLISLRSARNDADYDLRTSAFSSKKIAATEVAIAEEIVAAVANQHSIPEVRASMRIYARDTLRLVVTGND